MVQLDLGIEDVVWIGGDLYCKTRDALDAARRLLVEIGYEIENLRTDSHSVKEGRVTVEEMVRNGHSLWYARLPDLRKAKCGSCGGYVSIAGSRVHGRTCELCGAVIYREIIDGSTVRFRFADPGEQGMFSPELQMEAHRWDAEEGWLYLKPGFLERGGLGVVSGEKAERYMALHACKWQVVTEEDGGAEIKLYKLHYRRDIYRHDDDVIEMMDIWGHDWNHTVVNVWDGVEYPEYSSDMPVPESFSIYEAWHWAPLEPTPTLHQRLLGAIHNHDDKGWHYQDGRPWFSRRSWEQIGLFIRHFTTLDADEWDRQSRRFPLDGPGGIDAVAAFCHPLAAPENKPNVGNLLVAMENVIQGRPNTRAEEGAALDALVFDETTAEFLDTLAARPAAKGAARKDAAEGQEGFAEGVIPPRKRGRRHGRRFRDQ